MNPLVVRPGRENSQGAGRLRGEEEANVTEKSAAESGSISEDDLATYLKMCKVPPVKYDRRRKCAPEVD
jgi:hypothetical protein